MFLRFIDFFLNQEIVIWYVRNWNSQIVWYSLAGKYFLTLVSYVYIHENYTIKLYFWYL